jgi:hypothetical protein
MWKAAVSNKRFLIEIIFSIIFLLIILTFYTRFLEFAEARKGFSFNDPILKLFLPTDLTWLIFGIIYFCLIAAVLLLLKNPLKLLEAVQIYILIVLVRIISMYLLPLDPPETIIPLADPLVEFFGSGKTLTKDLFFSGHTATLFFLFLIIEKKSIKILFFFSTLIVAAALIIQHVHYTIDIFAAIFFTYAVNSAYTRVRNEFITPINLK